MYLPCEVLVVEDDREMRESLHEWLRSLGMPSSCVASAGEALRVLEKQDVSLLITDLVLPDSDGIELMKSARARHPDAACLVISGYATVAAALAAMKEGADDFIEKPFCPGRLEEAIRRALAKRGLQRENRLLRKELEGRRRLGDLLGTSDEMQRIFELIRTVAPGGATVLIQGESGTGKELVARALHRCSPRAAKPFIAVNCAALPEALLESELFGHEKGAFTGAAARHKGRFEQAQGGTLFLDEIGEMSRHTQVVLLRVLQEKSLRRVGGTALIRTDARIVCASNRDVRALVEEGRFREDLWYRLNVVSITLPPLRDRREDVLPLARHFLKRYAEENGKEITGFTPEAVDLLLRNPWKGNVRQLQHAVESAVVMARGRTIAPADLPAELAVRPRRDAPPELFSLKEMERRHICAVLDRCGGNKSAAARLLGIERATLYCRLKEYGVQ